LNIISPGRIAWLAVGVPEKGEVGVNGCAGLDGGANAAAGFAPLGNGAAGCPDGDVCSGGNSCPVDSESGATSDTSACASGITASCALITVLRIDALIRFKQFSFLIL
jgi:hypothetical protein